MNAYWVTFVNRPPICVDARTKEQATVRAERLFGRTQIDGGSFHETALKARAIVHRVEVLPYPRHPRAGFDCMHEDCSTVELREACKAGPQKWGLCPSFCYGNDECLGRSSCPKRPACSE